MRLLSIPYAAVLELSSLFTPSIPLSSASMVNLRSVDQGHLIFKRAIEPSLPDQASASEGTYMKVEKLSDLSIILV